jgi:hypothetical protein
VTNIPEGHCQTPLVGGPRAPRRRWNPCAQARSGEGGAALRPGTVGERYSRDVIETFLRRGSDCQERFAVRSATEMTTELPSAGGACRRRARVRARADRANPQLVPPGTPGPARDPRNSGQTAPTGTSGRKMQIITWGCWMEASEEHSLHDSMGGGFAKNFSLILGTSASGPRDYCWRSKRSDRENAARSSSRCCGLGGQAPRGDSVLQVVVGGLGRRVFNNSTLLWNFYAHRCG